MSTMLVTYDLNREAKRPDITGVIKKNWSCVKLSESSYAIAAGIDPDAVYARLKPLLDANDTLYVITLKQPHAGFGPQEVNDWLAEHLTY
jgi:hypothetical protein